jgi:hypothetical protein
LLERFLGFFSSAAPSGVSPTSAVAFFAVVFFAADFVAADFVAADFFAEVFFAAGFFGCSDASPASGESGAATSVEAAFLVVRVRVDFFAGGAEGVSAEPDSGVAEPSA